MQFPSPGSTLITMTNEAAPPDAALDAPPTPTTSTAAPDPDYVTCDLCGGAGWVPAFVVRRDWVRGKDKGKGLQGYVVALQ